MDKPKFAIGDSVALIYFTGDHPLEPTMTISGIVDRGAGQFQYICAYMNCGDPRETFFHESILQKAEKKRQK